MSIRAVNWACEVCALIGVPAATRITLWAIARRHHDKTGACYPSYDTIARDTGYSRRKVISDVQEFEFNGLLFRQERRVSGRQGSNNFVLFGRPKFKIWTPSRVQGGAPCQSAPAFTPSRVHLRSPNRDKRYNTIGPCEVVTFEPFPAKKEIASSGSGGGAA